MKRINPSRVARLGASTALLATVLMSAPALATDSSVAGFAIEATVPRLDLASSRLPANLTYRQSIVNMLQLLTTDWHFTSQDSLGAIRITNSSGGKVVILPVGSQMVDADRQDGVQCSGNGLCQSVASNIVTTFNAAVDDPAALVAAVRQYDPAASVSINNEGNIKASVAGRTYLAQASWNVFASSSAGGSVLVADGAMVWLNAASGKQGLYPVMANLDRLIAVARKLDPTATARGDHQGKVILVYQGQPFSLTPAWEVIATPAAHAKEDYWLENGVVFINYLDGTAQGVVNR